MVLMDADDSGHHNPKAKPAPASTSPAAPATRTRLHDFTFPPMLSWGTHRLLRCSKDGAPAPASASPPPQKEKPQGAAAESQPPRPWNLRNRRSATAAPPAAGSEKAAARQAQQPLASPRADARKRGFSVALTKEEIVEDFLAMRGARPPRRPKKRPRAVQRQLDMLYPGLSLADVNLDSYKIEEGCELRQTTAGGVSALHYMIIDPSICLEGWNAQSLPFGGVVLTGAVFMGASKLFNKSPDENIKYTQEETSAAEDEFEKKLDCLAPRIDEFKEAFECKIKELSSKRQHL